MLTIQPSSTPVVILAGGTGSRLGEYTNKIPKPMVEIGGIPILIHIMLNWYKSGFRDFIIAGGYKWEYINDYFTQQQHLSYFPSQISVVVKDTGMETNTAGRLLKLRSILPETFCLSYGDGITNFELKKLLQKHLDHNPLVTMLVVHPLTRFGEVIFNGQNLVTSFLEKPISDKWSNAGFFVLNKGSLDYIYSSDDSLEVDTLPRIVRIWGVGAVECEEFWHSLDTPKDLNELENLWKDGAPWL